MAGLGFQVIAACYTMEGAQFLNSVATIVVANLTTKQGLKKVVVVVYSQVAAKEDTELWANVNNAGMHMPGNVKWLPLVAYQRVMALNFHAPIHLIHKLTPLL
jgi:NAD(P)-dependent dehydrogenase (short-subunit alcohol dehydrogenase family)